MLDLVTLGETMVAFIPGEPTYLRYVDSFGKTCAGAESNVAVGLCKLGRTAGWMSKVGNDEFGEFILRELRGEGVDTSRVLRHPDRPTGIMFKQFVKNSESSVFYYRKNSAAASLCPADLDEAYIASARMLLVSGITPALSPECRAAVDVAVDMAKRHGVLVCFDPNIRKKLWTAAEAKDALTPLLPRCDVVLLGADEAELLLGVSDPGEIVRALRGLGVRWMGIKMGAEGARVADGDRDVRIPAFPVHCVDNIGAGDAFNAGFLCGLLEGAPIEECGRMAALMGALAVSVPGDTEGIPNRAAFDGILRNARGADR